MAKKPKDEPKAPPAPKRAEFVAALDCALGAGRIPPGQAIFTAERVGRKGFDPETVEPIRVLADPDNETVEPVEGPGLGDNADQIARVLENALNNPRLLEVR